MNLKKSIVVLHLWSNLILYIYVNIYMFFKVTSTEMDCNTLNELFKEHLFLCCSSNSTMLYLKEKVHLLASLVVRNGPSALLWFLLMHIVLCSQFTLRTMHASMCMLWCRRRRSPKEKSIIFSLSRADLPSGPLSKHLYKEE